MEIVKLLFSSELIAQIVSFLVLLFLLRAFAWKKILLFLDQRKEKIASEYKFIEDTKSSVENLKKDYDDKIRDIENERRKMLQQAVFEAKEIQTEIKKNARDEADKIVESAKAAMKDEVVKVKQGIKNEVVDLIISAAERVTEAKLSSEEDKKIVEDFIAGLEQNK